VVQNNRCWNLVLSEVFDLWFVGFNCCANSSACINKLETLFEFFEGVMQTQATVSRGRRISASRAYLRPIAHRNNLHIVTLAHVNQVFNAQKFSSPCKSDIYITMEGCYLKAILLNLKRARSCMVTAWATGMCNLLTNVGFAMMIS
jgi:GMC oxidoreductase